MLKINSCLTFPTFTCRKASESLVQVENCPKRWKKVGLKWRRALAEVFQQQLVVLGLRGRGHGGGRAALGAQGRVSKGWGRRQRKQFLQILRSPAAHASPSHVLINFTSCSIVTEVGDGRHLGVCGDRGGGLSAPGRKVRGADSSVRGRGGGGACGDAWQHHGVEFADVGCEAVHHTADLVHDGGALGLAPDHPDADITHAYHAYVALLTGKCVLVVATSSSETTGRFRHKAGRCLFLLPARLSLGAKTFCCIPADGAQWRSRGGAGEGPRRHRLLVLLSDTCVHGCVTVLGEWLDDGCLVGLHGLLFLDVERHPLPQVWPVATLILRPRHRFSIGTAKICDKDAQLTETDEKNLTNPQFLSTQSAIRCVTRCLSVKVSINQLCATLSHRHPDQLFPIYLHILFLPVTALIPCSFTFYVISQLQPLPFMFPRKKNPSVEQWDILWEYQMR